MSGVVMGDDGPELVDEGYECPNEAVASLAIKTHSSGVLSFDVCEEHEEEWRDDEIVEEVVERYD
jgi:hypothetical protein